MCDGQKYVSPISAFCQCLWMVCLLCFVFVGWRLSSHSTTFHYYGDVTSTCACTRHACPLRSRVTRTVHLFIRSYAMTRNTHIGFRAIGRGATITCLNDLGLSQPGNEPRSFVCEANVVWTEILWFVCRVYGDNERSCLLFLFSTFALNSLLKKACGIWYILWYM